MRSKIPVLVTAGLVAAHTVDDAFVQPEPGTSAGNHVISGLVPLGALALTAILAVRGPSGVRAVASVVIGLSAVVSGIEAAVRSEPMRRSAADDHEPLHLVRSSRSESLGMGSQLHSRPQWRHAQLDRRRQPSCGG